MTPCGWKHSGAMYRGDLQKTGRSKTQHGGKGLGTRAHRSTATQGAGAPRERQAAPLHPMFAFVATSFVKRIIVFNVIIIHHKCNVHIHGGLQQHGLKLSGCDEKAGAALLKHPRFVLAVDKTITEDYFTEISRNNEND